MDRAQLLLVGVPLLLFCSDLVGLFTPSPPKQSAAPGASHRRQQAASVVDPPDFASAAAVAASHDSQLGGVGYGTTVLIKFCASCSYRGTAVTMKKMLEASFPGINVVLQNYPPPLPKQLLSKAVPVFQVGAIGMIMAGDQIFPRLGITPPQLFYQLRANRFGTMATVWLLGNFAQSFLQSSGAFEVYCNEEPVFSKLQEQRFPSEFELRELISKRLPDTKFGTNLGKVWA